MILSLVWYVTTEVWLVELIMHRISFWLPHVDANTCWQVVWCAGSDYRNCKNYTLSKQTRDKVCSELLKESANNSFSGGQLHFLYMKNLMFVSETNVELCRIKCAFNWTDEIGLHHTIKHTVPLTTVPHHGELQYSDTKYKQVMRIQPSFIVHKLQMLGDICVAMRGLKKYSFCRNQQLSHSLNTSPHRSYDDLEKAISDNDANLSTLSHKVSMKTTWKPLFSPCGSLMQNMIKKKSSL